ncbi:uncharacterized protein LOC122252964 isoform X1 [Penaeus japonicus]|uniref:uncharacterized protein LOC122252964 isoform X1 n=1 Tax=Penaeus japonicus TaxID=27405 RepID=UPI001C712536|nr:uncharacterized protein LOC122252964 isoform X1 [Penaeus japonicus]
MDHQPETVQLNPVSPAPRVPQAPPAVRKSEVRCCGCLPLRAGTIAIGVLYLVSCLSSGVYITYLYINYHGDMRRIVMLVTVALVIVSISTIATSLLLYGAVKNRHGFFLPWIIWECISCGLLIIMTLNSITGPSGLPDFSIFNIRIYFLYIVIKHRNKLLARAVDSQAMC